MKYISPAPADSENAEKIDSGCPFCEAPASLDSSSAPEKSRSPIQGQNSTEASVTPKSPVQGQNLTPKPDTDTSVTPGSPASLLLLYKGEHTSVIMNKYPYSNGHLMVSPLSHTADLVQLPPVVSAELFDMTKVAVKILAECMNPDGFNVGMNLGSAAGAGIAEHLHMHVVPRWNGDTNFMPVLSDIKVMPEHIDATYAKLKPLFESI